MLRRSKQENAVVLNMIVAHVSYGCNFRWDLLAACTWGAVAAYWRRGAPKGV